MTAASPSTPVLTGARVYRIHWTLGTDRLRAVCHCAAEREFEDPVDMWEWLLAHPSGHEPAPFAPEPAPVTAGVPALT